MTPLLLIPFVENAFKHGVLNDPITPVRLHLAVLAGALEFNVVNQCHDYRPDPGSGIGLTNLHRRLELLYPGQYAWQVGPVGQQFRAHLRLDGLVQAAIVAANPSSTRVPTLAAVPAV